MLAIKRTLPLFLLLAVCISLALIVPLRKLEAKGQRPSQPFFGTASPALAGRPVGPNRISGSHSVSETNAYGPSSLLTLFPQLYGPSFAIPSALVGRVVRVVDNSLQANQNGTVSVELDSQGDENALGFSLVFDPTKLTYVSTARGADATSAGATMNVNATQTASGRLGIAIGLPAGSVFSAGTRQMVIVTFSVPASGSGSTTINFGDVPIFREIVDVNAGELLATYTPGTINITPLPSPVPVLSSISPTSAFAGGAAFTLTANGSSFVNTSVVRFNGSDRSTTFVSSTQLTAQITAADIQATGSFPITVFNPAPGGGTSGAVNLAVNNPVPTASSLSPTNTLAGGPAFTLTVNGSGFSSSSVVRFKGNDRSTTAVNSTQVTAQITAADIATPGSASVAVFNPTPGGGLSNTLNFTINSNPAFRIVRVAGATFVAGQNNSVNVELDSQGDENALGFSLNFDTTKLTYVSAVKGADASNATLNVNSASAASGRIGIALANPAGEVFPLGTRQILVLTFSAQLPTSGSTVISFGDLPIAREIVDGNAQILAATFTSGTVNINHPVPGPITSISPTGVTTGDSAFTLTVNGSNFVSQSVVRVNGSDRTTTFVNSGQLTAQVTAADIQAGGTIPITVFTPAPGGGTSNSINLTVNNPTPAIATLSPNSALAGGPAFTVTVNGSNFVNGAVVRWNGADRTTTFINGTQLTAQITAADIQSSGTASVTVFNPPPGGGVSPAATFTINNPVPAVTTVSPNSATVGGAGFTLTVNGSNFVSGSVVRFNGSDRVTTFVNVSQLTAQITAADIAATGTSQVTVFNPGPGGGISNSAGFDVLNPVCVLINLAPSSALAGGAAFTLTVNGSSFVNGAVVKWSGSDRTTSFVSSTQVTAEIPATDLATAGAFAVTVTNPAPGGGTSSALNFTVNNPLPAVTSLAPNNTVAGGAAFTLTVNGSSFVNGAVVNWNGSDRTTSFVSATQVTAQIPATDLTSAGTFPVTVVNPAPGGGTSSATNFTVNNPTVPPPTLSPNNAVAGGPAFTLTVNGSNFVNGAVVRWNGADRTTTFINGTQLTAQITAADIQSSGTASVTVFNPPPGGGVSPAATFTINNPVPAVTTVSPNSATVGGAGFTLTVNGSNFINGSVVRLNGSDRTTSFVSATQLTAQIPAADIVTTGSLPITVFNPAPGGGLSNAVNLLVNNPVPAITTLSPSSTLVGSAAFTLTVNGSSFVNGAVVKWNGSDRTTSFVSATQVTAEIPATDLTSAGSFAVTVNNPAPGGGLSNVVNFNVNNPVPAVTSLAPNSAVAGGAAFTLMVNGSSFVNGAVVKWNGADRSTTFVSGSQLTAQIAAADIQSAGSASVTVFNPAPGGGASTAASFAINNPVPTVTNISPTSATVGGPAFTLTVNGSNFVNGAIVRWNGSDRVTTFVSGLQVTAQITAADIAATGTAQITVFNPGPGGGLSNSAGFDVLNPTSVSITSLAPVSATLNGAAFTLTVNGNNFVNGSVVKWNGSDCATTFVNGTQLTAQITAADLTSAGSFAVTVVNPPPGGGTSNAVNFTVNNPVPVITTIAPTSAVAGDPAFTLTVNGSNFLVASVVTFEGSNRATSFVSGTQLTAQITAADLQNAGTFHIAVNNPGPGGGPSNIVNLTVIGPNPVPVMSGVSPASVTVGGAGFTLTVNGSNFINGSVVRLNGSDRTTSFVSATQLTAQIPAADIVTTGSLPITVFNPAPGGGLSNAVNLLVNNPVPAITTLSPSSTLVGSAAFTLTVNGSSFVNGAVVKWNGADRSTTFVSGSQLTAQIAAADIQSAGSASVTVFNPAPGGGASTAASFAINNPLPALVGISPTNVIAGGAAFTLTVNGSNFVSSSIVQWNASNRATTFVSSSQLTAQITAADIQSAGSATVSVFNPAPGGGTSNTLNLSTNNPIPAITTLAPSSALAGSANLILTVNGTNFVNGAVVRWNGSDRLTSFVDSTKLTAQITAADIQVVGTANVTVFNPAPGGGTSAQATFSVIASNGVPTIGTLLPASAVAGGVAFTLTVNGSNFVNGAVVRWEGADRPTTFVSTTQLTAQITASDIQAAGAFRVTVVSPPPGGGNSNPSTFTVVAPNAVPQIDAILPGTAIAGGPAFTLTVNGSNFVNGAVVRWQGADRATTFLSSTQLTAQITAADIQTVNTCGVTVVNPAPGGGESNALDFSITTGPAKLQFSSSSYEISESQQFIDITVMRTGEMTSAVTVDFSTDDSTVLVPCGNPSGGASQRCDYSTTGGTLSFASGESSHTFRLLITQDAYVEGNETVTLALNNPAVANPGAPQSALAGVALGAPATATLTILDDDMAPPTNNPIDDAQDFVTQHYMDFMSRIPDAGGLAYWTEQITRCGTDSACIHNRRIGVSGAFFVELEFQQTGSVVYRLYKAAYGQRPVYARFMPDRSQLVGGSQLPASTLAFANRFVTRPEFKSAYPDSMTPSEFVNKLFDTAVLLNSAAERQQAINALLAGSKTRANVLLDVIDIQEFKQREYNPAFVLMQYFGYLRRDVDQSGYDFWLDVVNNREPNNYTGMICAFVTSREYQERFSSIVTRSNQDCAR